MGLQLTLKQAVKGRKINFRVQKKLLSSNKFNSGFISLKVFIKKKQKEALTAGSCELMRTD